MTTPPLFFLPLAALAAISMLPLIAYVRMRRRGLLASSGYARLLMGSLAALAVCAMIGSAAGLAVGLALTAALWGLSRPMLPPAAHRKFAALGAGLWLFAVGASFLYPPIAN